MTFNIAEATSKYSLNQLKQAYYDYWTVWQIETIYEMWYTTSEFENTDITCRIYYKYTDGVNNTSGGYYTNYMTYNTVTKLYSMASNGNPASSTSNELTQVELLQLTLFYKVVSPETGKTITLWNALIHKNNSFNKPGLLITNVSGPIY